VLVVDAVDVVDVEVAAGADVWVVVDDEDPHAASAIATDTAATAVRIPRVVRGEGLGPRSGAACCNSDTRLIPSPLECLIDYETGRPCRRHARLSNLLLAEPDGLSGPSALSPGPHTSRRLSSVDTVTAATSEPP